MMQEDGAMHVLEGPERPDDIEHDADFNLEDDQVKKKFKKFVVEYSKKDSTQELSHQAGIDLTTLKYRVAFMNNCAQELYKLTLNLNDMEHHQIGDLLLHRLKQQPSWFIDECEQGLKELYCELIPDAKPRENAPSFQLLLTCDANLEGTSGTFQPIMLRELVSSEVQKLVVIQGIIVKSERPRHKASKVTLKCTNCENIKEIQVPKGFSAALLPKGCDGNVTAGPLEKCPQNPFQVVTELCQFTDQHVMKLQELPESVPVGEMPRSITLLADRHLVDRCTAGTRLTVVGIFIATESAQGGVIAKARDKGAETVKFSYVLALGMDVAQGNTTGNGSIPITKDEEERFNLLAKDPEIREKIYKSIAPAICASKKDVTDEVKKSVACLLFGGSRNVLPDGTRRRGDINVLLLGDPSTAKSQFLKFAQRTAPISVFTSGKGSSAAGLTAAVVRESGAGGGFALEGGAMVLADGGVVCIDEFDKMRNDDRVAIHEAMEQQTISIAKAGITTVLNTRCSVLAAANPVFGTYDDLSSTAEQIDFQSTILSRFDMIFLVKDVRDTERDKMIARHVLELHKGGLEKNNEETAPISVADLRKYVSYCRNAVSPRLTPDACETLKNHYIDIRAKMAQEKREGKDNNVIPITVRQLEAIVRISESLAKMQLRDQVEVADVEEALRLFTVSTLDAANRERGIGIQTFTEEQKKELHRAEEIVRRRIQIGGRMHKQQIIIQLTGQGVEEQIAKVAVHDMTMRGELIEKPGLTLLRAM
jgi:DNA replication licensing factor MCM5